MCQFYETPQDLADVLIPYFKAGLEHNEFCMWICSEPLDANQARKALQAAFLGLDTYLKRGQIEIRAHEDWYLQNGVFDSQRVLDGWIEKMNSALGAGYDGLRLTGNTHWLEKAQWDSFAAYENQVNGAIRHHRMLAVCSYALEKCGVAEILDVMINHQFALLRRHGKWQVIEHSERRRADEEVRQAAAFPLQDPNPVLAINLEGQFLFANPAAARTFPTLSAEGLRHCIMADWPSVADALRRRSPPMVRREVKVDGAWYLQVFFHAAELDRVLVYLVDITDRRQADEATQKAQAELLEERQHEKEHAEAELARMRDRLVRATRLAAIGQVSASIAHDLRNPLGTVRNAAYYLERRLPKDQPEVAEYLGIINQEVAAADRIITNLLAVARAKEPVRQHVDLGQTIREALAETGQAEAVRLRMSLAPEPFVVRADPDQLRQVFRNLVANAVEAMDGGGEIVVEAAREADGDSIVLRDTGPGVAQEIRESVFEPLVTTKAKGIGLGLTICRQIIERHGGGIELIDEDKPGAAFRIRLPRP